MAFFYDALVPGVSPVTWRAMLVPGVICAVVLAMVGAYSHVSLAIVMLDGAYVLAAFGAATAMGMYAVRRIVGRSVEPAIRAALAPALGLGAMALFTLLCGVCGQLRYAHIAALGIGLACAVSEVRLYLAGRHGTDPARVGEPEVRSAHESSPAVSRWLLIAIAPFVAFALICATLPPGAPLREEGNGYDVLEYHLAAPKEYLAAGRIGYLPHNIYASMPANAEMLYLLVICAAGGALAGVYAAQLMHVAMGIAGVLAIWAAARPFGRSAALIAALTAASCPMLAHLGGLAYAELGLLAMAAGALACLIAGMLSDDATVMRWAVLCGVFVGLACGFKYTAVPMVAMPVCAAWMLRRRGATNAAWCAVVAAALFAPWMLKNAVATGNPIFPLARSIVQERDGIWSDELAGRFHEGHLPDPAQRSVRGRVLALVNHVIVTPLYGLILWPLGLIGAAALLARRGASADSTALEARSAGRVVMCCAALLLGTLATWAVATHLVSRFAIPMVAPLAVLCGITWNATQPRGGMKILAVAFMVVGMIGNMLLLANHRRHDSPFGVARQLPGATGLMTSAGAMSDLNDDLSAGRRVLIVAEARTLYLNGAPPAYDYRVVFNRNPFAEFAASHSPTQTLDWLRAQPFERVYVDWREMARLRESRYGFWPGVTPELFQELTRCGLQHLRDYRLSDDAPPYATLYSTR